MLPSRSRSRHEPGEAYDPYMDPYGNGGGGGGGRRRGKSLHDSGIPMPNLRTAFADPTLDVPYVAQYQQFMQGSEGPPPMLPLGPPGYLPPVGGPDHLFIQAQPPPSLSQGPQYSSGYVSSPAVAYPPAPLPPESYPPFGGYDTYPPPPPPGHSVSPPPHPFAGGQRPYTSAGHGAPPPAGYSPVFDDDEDSYSEGRRRRRHRESTGPRRQRAPSMHTGLTPTMSNISLPSSGSSGYHPPNHRHSAAEGQGALTRYSPPPSPRRRRSTHYSSQNRPPIHHHPTSDPPDHYYPPDPRDQDHHHHHRPKGSSRGRSYGGDFDPFLYGDPRSSAPTLHTPEYEFAPATYDNNGYFLDHYHQHQQPIEVYDDRRRRGRTNKSRPGSPVSEPARRSKSISARPRPSEFQERPIIHQKSRMDLAGDHHRDWDRDRDREPMSSRPQRMSYDEAPHPPPILKNRDEKPPGPTGILKNRNRTPPPPSERLEPPAQPSGTKSASASPKPRPKSTIESKTPNNNWREQAGVQPGNTFMRPDLMCAMATFGLCGQEGTAGSHNALMRLDCGHGFHEECLRDTIAAKEKTSSAAVDLEKDKLWCDRCRNYFGKKAGR